MHRGLCIMSRFRRLVRLAPANNDVGELGATGLPIPPHFSAALWIDRPDAYPITTPSKINRLYRIYSSVLEKRAGTDWIRSEPLSRQPNWSVLLLRTMHSTLNHLDMSLAPHYPRHSSSATTLLRLRINRSLMFTRPATFILRKNDTSLIIH
jgi:hypothetical protein